MFSCNELYQKDLFLHNREDEFREKFKYLDEPDFISKKYNSFVIFNLYQNFASKKKLISLADCGSFLGFDLYKNLSTSELKKKLSNANFCKDRFCDMCNWRRARKFGIQNYQILKTIELNQKVRYLFATFTIHNPCVSELRSKIKEFNRAWKRMTQTKRWRKSILGYIKAIEIPFQKNDNTRINLHAHCLLIVPSVYFKGDLYISQKEFTQLWKTALRVDYTPVVDVRIIKSKNDVSDPIWSVVAETTKYPLKSIDLRDIDWKTFKELVEQTHHLRFVNYGGIAKDYRKMLFSDDDLENGDLIYSVDDELDELFWEKVGKLWYSLEAGKYVLHNKDLSQIVSKL